MKSVVDMALARVDHRMTLVGAGIGVVVVPPGEQRRHAESLARNSARALVDLSALSADGAPNVFLVPGLPKDQRAASIALASLNGMRNRLSAAGHLVVLVLFRRELSELQRHAPDAYSARLFVEDVPFAADLTVDPDAARVELAKWQRERFGRLDLRGFIRSETEDVSWRIEDIYQDIGATSAMVRDGRAVAYRPEIEQSVVDWLSERHSGLLEQGEPVVILGHPGSGKTFFLRWLALRLACEATFLDIERPLPLLASLAAYAESPGPVSLYDYLIESLLESGQSAAHILGRCVDEKRAVFLLDGLDEVGDESARRRMVEAIAALGRQAPDCAIVITSRIAGYGSTVLPTALHLMLSPFGDDAIRGFLIKWCELYSLDRSGNSIHARQVGKSEGEQLARDVLTHIDVRELARNPLLLTVLAIVHRAGVRLPDHRIELYEHATRVLVERWNRVRSLTLSRPPPPLKAADAVRLLGPIALRMVRSGIHGLVHEIDLRRMLDKALSSGTLRGVATADEAIALFRNSLGLLVEQGPGVYAFIHLTLAEYFAAWELVRSSELELLVSREVEAFHPQWREVILLAAGELGVIRADDGRLERVVSSLLDSASRRPGKPSATVPSLFGGLLADDPGLTNASIEALVHALVPTWWFGRRYGATNSLALAVREATQLVQGRIQGGRAAEALRREIVGCYGNGIPATVYANLVRGGAPAIVGFLRFLAAADVDNGPSFMSCFKSGHVGRRAVAEYTIPITSVRIVGDDIVGRVSLSRIIDGSVRAGMLSASLVCNFRGLVRPAVHKWGGGKCEWPGAPSIENGSRDYVTLSLRVNAGGLVGATRITGSARVELAEPLV